MAGITHPAGTYGYAPGIRPYSGGVRATPGHEIEHVSLLAVPQWREGFAAIDDHLAERGMPRTALCAIELRCPQPHSFGGFSAFNEEYRGVLSDWGLLDGDTNPVARTNVAPVEHPPGDTTMAAFSVTVPSERSQPSFVIAGAGDLVDQADLRPEAIVGAGDAATPSWERRANQVLDEMEARMATLDVAWSDVSTIDVYCAQAGWSDAMASLTRRLGPAVGRGLHWFVAHPPIEGLTFEMDVRGVALEVWR